MAETMEKKTWSDSLRSFSDIRSITMLLLGFSAGLPILMIFSSLSLWLREAGVERSAVTYFSWAALGYSFKFIWAPLVDRLPLPFLTSTLVPSSRMAFLFSQVMIIISIASMALIDPALGDSALTKMAIATVLLGFSSATQDIVIDAYRIESAPSDWRPYYLQPILQDTELVCSPLGQVPYFSPLTWAQLKRFIFIPLGEVPTLPWPV